MRKAVYVPDGLYNEVMDLTESTNFSGLVQLALDAFIDNLRPRCSGCQLTLKKDWKYCPNCGERYGVPSS